MERKTNAEIARNAIGRALNKRQAGPVTAESIRAFFEDAVAECAAELAAKDPPKDHVRMADGTFAKVLGTLPMTADGCVAGREAGLWTTGGAKWMHYMFASEFPAPIEYDPQRDSEELYSTKEAAEAARAKS